MEMSKGGISPVIATVILVSMVVVIGVIIFAWFRTLTVETIMKGNENVIQACGEVSFSAQLSDGNLVINNNGNIPIASIKVKETTGGNADTNNLNGLDKSISPGGVVSVPYSSSPDKLELIPVLLGKADSGDKTYVCEDRALEVNL